MDRQLKPAKPNERFFELPMCLTSQGVFKCVNGTAEPASAAVWQLQWSSPDLNWKAIEYHPVDPLKAYVGGRDIFETTDGGSTWTSMSLNYPGFDLEGSPFSASHPVSRINIAVSPIAPYDVLAFAHGTINTAVAYRFDPVLEEWHQGTAFSSYNGTAAWMCVAVSPTISGEAIFATTQIRRTPNWGSTLYDLDTYWQDVHPDSHAVEYSPDGTEIWVGHDGGISFTQDVLATSTAATWHTMNVGLSTGTYFRISSSPTSQHDLMVGTQDDGNNRRYFDNGEPVWAIIQGADGGSVKMSPDGQYAWSQQYNVSNRDIVTKWSNNFASGTVFNWWVTLGAWGCTLFPTFDFIPGTGEWFFSASDTWQENDMSVVPSANTDFTRVTDLQSDYGGLQYFVDGCISQRALRTEYAELDPERVYVVTDLLATPAGDPCYPYVDHRIYASHVDPNTGLMYPSGSPSKRMVEVPMPTEWYNNPSAISALAVDPLDPLHIYIGFSGYNPALRVFEGYLHPDDPTLVEWIDLDPDNILPVLPVVDLVAPKGTALGLYVALDIGVYYRNGSTDWQPFYEDLPNVQLRDLDIHYCTSSIRIATFGRGVWESKLAESAIVERVISADETWANHRNLAQDIRVTNGATLTIANTVNFAPETRLIIDPGARLVVEDGGKLTNLCGEQWDGVEVRGNSSASQIPLSNQGYLELRGGSSIEHAVIAIRLYQSDEQNIPTPGSTGGVLKAYGQSANQVYIRNCAKGLHMLPYENRPNGSNEINNRTSLAWTVFETDQNDAEYCARLEDVSGVSFSSCTFRDNASSPSWYGEQRPDGIKSFSSKFTVRNSTFWRLRTAIEASNDGLLNPAFIRTNTFDLCRWGILLDGVHAAEVTGNTFIVPQGALYGGQQPLEQTDPPLGLYLHTCEGYEVEENEFRSDLAHAVGLVVTDNSSGANQFYKNTFNGLLVGSLLQGDNRDVDGQGLQCLCNDYGLNVGNVYKIAITWGGEIAQFQGQPPVFPNPAKPAGNRFYPECLAGTDASDIYVQDDGQLGFTYISHTQDFCLPDCRTPSFVNVIPTFGYGDDQSATPSCPPQLGHGHFINDHLLKYALYKQAYTDLKIYLDGQLDGGDTPDLLAMIADEGVSSFNLRLELLAASPRLTDRVMIAAIQRDPAMDSWHLAQVLLANSPLTPDVMLTLDRSDVLPTYRSMVAAAQTGGLSLRSMLEAELSGYRLGMEGPRFDAVRFYLERDTVVDPLDSVLTVLGDPVVPSAAYNVACLHLARGDWSAAQGIIGNAGNNGLDVGSTQVLQLLLNVRQQPEQAAAMVSAAAADLIALVSGSTPASSAARSLLGQYTGASFEHAVVLPGNRRPRSMQEQAERDGERMRLEVMPNPASTSFRVLAELPIQSTGGNLTLIDGTGRVLRDHALKAGANLLDLPVADLANGYYRLRVRSSDGVERSMAIQVSH